MPNTIKIIGWNVRNLTDDKGRKGPRGGGLSIEKRVQHSVLKVIGKQMPAVTVLMETGSDNHLVIQTLRSQLNAEQYEYFASGDAGNEETYTVIYRKDILDVQDGSELLDNGIGGFRKGFAFSFKLKEDVTRVLNVCALHAPFSTDITNRLKAIETVGTNARAKFGIGSNFLYLGDFNVKEADQGQLTTTMTGINCKLLGPADATSLKQPTNIAAGASADVTDSLFESHPYDQLWGTANFQSTAGSLTEVSRLFVQDFPPVAPGKFLSARNSLVECEQEKFDAAIKEKGKGTIETELSNAAKDLAHDLMGAIDSLAIDPLSSGEPEVAKFKKNVYQLAKEILIKADSLTSDIIGEYVLPILKTTLFLVKVVDGYYKHQVFMSPAEHFTRGKAKPTGTREQAGIPFADIVLYDTFISDHWPIEAYIDESEL